ncbi:MAG TPA: hypothetical protein VGL42_09785 [Opitutaceae bacterium]
MAKISVERYQDATVPNGKCPDSSVSDATQSRLHRRQRIMSGGAQPESVGWGKIFVEEKYHALANTTSSAASWEAYSRQAVRSSRLSCGYA